MNTMPCRVISTFEIRTIIMHKGGITAIRELLVHSGHTFLFDKNVI